MTSQQQSGTQVSAPEQGREVLNFYYLVDPEERLQLGWLAYELVRRVVDVDPDIIFFLDKSGRPLQHLFRKAWQLCQTEGEVRAEQFPRQIGFLHIGRDDPEGLQILQRLLTSKDLPQLAGYYRRKLGRAPRRVLIVDEILGTGKTMSRAFEVVSTMFPGVQLGGFYFQDSTGKSELFVKPGGDRQATWKTSLDEHLVYGLPGVTDIYREIREQYPDILAYRPALRSDWEEQLDFIEGECAMDFGISLRLVGPYIYETLENVKVALAEYPDSIPAQRGIRYAARIRNSLRDALPNLAKKKLEQWLPVHERLPQLRQTSREQIICLRVAACYWNKLICMMDAVAPQSPDKETVLKGLQWDLERQNVPVQNLAHRASEWETARLYDQLGPAALQFEISRLRDELTASVDLYWRYRQHSRRALPE